VSDPELYCLLYQNIGFSLASPAAWRESMIDFDVGLDPLTSILSTSMLNYQFDIWPENASVVKPILLQMGEFSSVPVFHRRWGHGMIV
jgi:hypothetical protein